MNQLESISTNNIYIYIYIYKQFDNNNLHITPVKYGLSFQLLLPGLKCTTHRLTMLTSTIWFS